MKLKKKKKQTYCNTSAYLRLQLEITVEQSYVNFYNN